MANGAGAVLSIPREPRGLFAGHGYRYKYPNGRRSSTRTGEFRSSRGASCEANRPWGALFRTAPIGSHCRQSAFAVHVVIPPPRSWSAPPRCSSSCERRCFSPLRSASQGPDGRVQRQRRKHGSMELRLDLDGAHAAPLWPSRGWRRRWPCRGTAYTCAQERRQQRTHRALLACACLFRRATQAPRVFI